MTVIEQARVFLAMALCGALLGAVYDALGALRRGRILTAAADLLFGVLAAGAVIAAALALCCEAYRLYTLLGVSAGFALYQCSIGTFVRFLKGRLKNLSKKEKN
ncbi:MAG: spore cortex biosynthesis protein YabQ [Candidatus Ventricola sp.]